MRIVHFSDLYVSYGNGVAVSMMNAAQELGRRGHEVLIIAPRGSRKEPVESQISERVRVRTMPSYPALVYPGVRIGVPPPGSCMKVIRKFAPDIIHVHTPLSLGLCGLGSGKRLGIPVVGTNHVFLTKDNADFFRLFGSYPFVMRMIGSAGLRYFHLFYGACDLVLSPSRAIVDEMRASKMRSRVEHLQNPLILPSQPRLTPEAAASIKKQWKLRERVIVHCGRISHEKNVDIVIEAFAAIRKARSDVSLLLIGDGPASRKIDALVKKLRLSDGVVRTGMLPHEELLSSGLLACADVFVTASTMENQPMAVLEAMAFGLPIVAVAEAGLRDLVSDNGILGIPFDPEDMAGHLRFVLDHPDACANMSQASLAGAQEHSAARVVDRLLGYYESLTSARPPPHQRVSPPAKRRIARESPTPTHLPETVVPRDGTSSAR